MPWRETLMVKSGLALTHGPIRCGCGTQRSFDLSTYSECPVKQKLWNGNKASENTPGTCIISAKNIRILWSHSPSFRNLPVVKLPSDSVNDLSHHVRCSCGMERNGKLQVCSTTGKWLHELWPSHEIVCCTNIKSLFSKKCRTVLTMKHSMHTCCICCAELRFI